ncbi:SusC/RagA family TonB-linked outer membrane protein [Chitinophagaceae bacterium LB-8]|uniref:SusC/RagA family TonB-linked outer membrane protein n=1 Tax=Paraflavisolibacter caeni TaxID=2982496 RepID=A0A9X2XTI9_9BACT|nr:SusC/RagA family TonB-linked outer membrane protein [Paraflavisolibacter caeni]MCU7548741.1 SusC/RagA family TonB-linked outer membrane protein [Paraflavisolibacter caeni]
MKKYRLLTFILLHTVFFAFAQNRQVSGVITDVQSNQPLVGVTIQVANQKTTAVTGPDGKFTINVPNGKSILNVSYVGYQTKSIEVAPDQNSISLGMEIMAGQMNEVVVTALGIKKEQRKLGYATSTVSGQDIVKTVPTNFASGLYGKAPGVQINTMPGGATSAVSIQIRGISSLSFQREPLLVVDGVIVRNGGANNEGYWGGNQKLNGNGLLDINPENIESVNILKGAAASALYGSDANFGVIVITTKSGKGYKKGIGVDASFSANVENVANNPDYQNTYGPGYDRATNLSQGYDEDGWFHTNVNGQDVVYPYARAYGQFGPKMDGRQVYWWDGVMRPYDPQPDNWKEFYRTGHSYVANVAINNATDKLNYRFSYTRNDYKGIQIGGDQNKNTFNFNTSYKITPKLTFDLVAGYINEKVHNRPRQIYYLTNNFGGFYSRADKMDVYFNKYQTSKGYKWVDFNSNLDQDERLKYNIRAKDFLDFLWFQQANSYDEITNRLVGSATLNYNIIKGLNLRGRYGTDYTGYSLESKERSTQQISAGASGAYSTQNNKYNFTYGDLLLSYDHKLMENLGLTASIGYQARKEDYKYNSASTRDGLTTENWFSMSASKTQNSDGTVPGSSSRSTLVKDGLFGILSFDYHNYLFVEGTIRRERSSTLNPDNNTFYYPGVSAAFELSNAFSLPEVITYSKLRAAWGIVGNPPPPYYSNVVYTAGNIQGVPSLTPPTSGYGNPNLKNESKHELEFGWENRLFSNRLGFDITYYNDKIKDQILTLTTPSTTGSSSVVVNVGDMRNYGLELSLYGTPLQMRDFTWDSRLNLSFNRNKVETLMEGLEFLDHANIDNGSLLVRSKAGEIAGNIYVYKRQVDKNGNYIVNDAGFYLVNYDQQQKIGNIQPKMTGGLINTLNYKNFSFNFLIDFRYGGQVVSPSMLYTTAAGMYSSTMFGRDAEHGGIPYYIDAAGKFVRVADGATTGPNGQKVYHNGMILKGATKDGKENTTIIDAPRYYLNTFDWGSWPGYQTNSLYEAAVFDNDFVKLREASLSYEFPTSITNKIKMQHLTLTFFGRNLFYFYKSLPNLDPEEGVGTDWVSRATSVGSGNAATRSYGASIRFNF